MHINMIFRINVTVVILYALIYVMVIIDTLIGRLFCNF